MNIKELEMDLLQELENKISFIMGEHSKKMSVKGFDQANIAQQVMAVSCGMIAKVKRSIVEAQGSTDGWEEILKDHLQLADDVVNSTFGN